MAINSKLIETLPSSTHLTGAKLSPVESGYSCGSQPIFDNNILHNYDLNLSKRIRCIQKGKNVTSSFSCN